MHSLDLYQYHIPKIEHTWISTTYKKTYSQKKYSCTCIHTHVFLHNKSIFNTVGFFPNPKPHGGLERSHTNPTTGYRPRGASPLDLPGKVSWLSRKSCWRPAPMMIFWVEKPIFFRHDVFFLGGAGGGWKSAIFFLYRWGFKVVKYPPFDPFGRSWFSSSFFSDVLEVTWRSLMRILGNAIFGAHENSPNIRFAKSVSQLMLQGFPTKWVIYGLLYTTQ